MCNQAVQGSNYWNGDPNHVANEEEKNIYIYFLNSRDNNMRIECCVLHKDPINNVVSYVLLPGLSEEVWLHGNATPQWL